mgnify:CR=1 FL=1
MQEPIFGRGFVERNFRHATLSNPVYEPPTHPGISRYLGMSEMPRVAGVEADR